MDSKKQTTRKWLIAKHWQVSLLFLLLFTLSPVASGAKDGDALREADILWAQAEKSTIAGDYQLAEQSLRQIIQITHSMDLKQRCTYGQMEKDDDRLTAAMLRLGYVLLNQRKTDEAFRMFADARQVASANARDQAVISLGVATVYRNLGKTKESEELVLNALNGLPLTADTVYRRVNLLQFLISLYQQQGRTDEAVKRADQLVSEVSSEKKGFDAKGKSTTGRLGTEEHITDALCAKAEFEAQVGDPSSAEQICRSYRNFILPGADDESLTRMMPQCVAAVELTLGKIAYRNNRLSEAGTHLNAAYQILSSQFDPHVLRDKELMTRILAERGRYFTDIGDFKSAFANHEMAQKYTRDLGKTEDEVEIGLRTAEMRMLQGAPEKALTILNEISRKLDTDATSRGTLKADVAVNRARCYETLGQMDTAVKLVNDAIKQYQLMDAPVQEAEAVHFLGVIYLDFNHPDKFVQLISEHPDLKTKLTDPRTRAQLDYNTAQAKLMLNKTDEAIALYQSASAAAAESKASDLQAAILRGKGLAYFLKGDYQSSLKAFDDSINAAGAEATIDAQWSANMGRGKALKALKRYDEAQKCLSQAVDLVEKERESLTHDAFKTHNLDFRRDCFWELVDLYALQKQDQKALEIAERGKARSFADMLVNRGARLVANAPEHSNVLMAMAPQGNGGNSANRSISVTGRAVSEDEGIPDEIIESNKSARAKTVDELKALVAKRGTPCIEYMLVKDKLYAWVVQPDGTISASHAIPEIAEAKKLVAALADNITATTTNMAQQEKQLLAQQKTLSRLYQILVQPVEAELPKDKNTVVTIVPESFLFRVPFAALMDSKGDFFIENHGLSYCPAIGIMDLTQAKNAEVVSKEHKLLAFGNPITEKIAFLGALPAAEKEVKEIATLYPPDAAHIEVKEGASKTALLKLAPQFSEIHLATHGLVDEDRPLNSAVVLAPEGKDDGLFNCVDILQMKDLKARLVVLSACETGKGKISGDGVNGLFRSFMIAGTPSVMVSMWNVDDVMTAYQMKKFYGAYLKGKDKASSLRDAQLATIKFLENTQPGQPRDMTKARANPRLWAAFQLIGEVN